MEWDATLGGMAKHGTEVKWWCQVCGRTSEIDVQGWCHIVGEDFSLWSVYIPCRFCDDGIMKAHARPSRGGTPFTPLTHYLASADGKGGFDFMQKFPQTPPYSHGIEE
ncbi:MAG: hypothetical protein ACK4UQ_06540 [Brevundimonas sp.]